MQSAGGLRLRFIRPCNHVTKLKSPFPQQKLRDPAWSTFNFRKMAPYW